MFKIVHLYYRGQTYLKFSANRCLHEKLVTLTIILVYESIPEIPDQFQIIIGNSNDS